LAGCASTSDIDSLRSEVRAANENSERAAAAAEAARQEAAAASRAAADAKAAAADAKATAQQTDEKIDRMFKKTMYK
jgi:murein lipoprotein